MTNTATQIAIRASHVKISNQDLQKHNIPHQIFRYPAEHGFFYDHGASYNAEVAADAWLKVKELFQKQLHTA